MISISELLNSRIGDRGTCSKVKAVVDGYRKSNRREQRALTENQIVRLIRQTIPVSELSEEDLDKLVERLLRPYDGKPIERNTSPTARDLLREDRKKQLRQRRKYWR